MSVAGGVGQHWCDRMKKGVLRAAGRSEPCGYPYWASGCSPTLRDGYAVKVTQAYRFAVDPAPAQERALRSHAGAARFAWNWGLAKCNERYAAESKWYSGTELHRLWNAEKKADQALAW